MRFLSLCLCLWSVGSFLSTPSLVQCSGPEVVTLQWLPGQQAIALADDQGRTLHESGRLSKYACTSLDGPDCGLVNGHDKNDIAQILASMLEKLGSSLKGTASDKDKDKDASSTASSSTSTSRTGKSTAATDKQHDDDTDTEDEDGTVLISDQLSALDAALTKKIKELFGRHIMTDSDADTETSTGESDTETDNDATNDETDGTPVEMHLVDGEVVDLTQVQQDGTSVHAFTIGADGETRAISPEELKQLLKQAHIMKRTIKGVAQSARVQDVEDETPHETQQQEDHEQSTGTHDRSPRPTRMTPQQMQHHQQQQQHPQEADREQPR